MTRTAEKERKFYLDVNDATEELGITRRQLKHWEDKGLLEPELGRNRYTENDLEQLRLVKRLVVEEGFPVDIVRRFFENRLWDREFDYDNYERGRTGDLTNYVLDVDSGMLLKRDQMFERLWHETLATADEGSLETLFAQIALVYFRHVRSQSRTPLGYLGQVEEILGRVQDLSRTARLESVYADYDNGNGPVIGIRLQPLLPGESDESEDLDALFARNESVITDLAEAGTELTRRGRKTPQQRFESFVDFIDLRS